MPRPRLLISGFGAFPAAPRNPAALAVETLAERRWSAAGVETSYLALPVAWRGAVEAIEGRLAGDPADGVLLVGLAVGAASFRVETLARNVATPTGPDHQGELWPHGWAAEGGPGRLDVTAPWDSMREAIVEAGLPGELSADAGDYLCNFTLYRLLHRRAAARIGFLHVPQARECAPEGIFGLEQIAAAVQAAAGALGAALRNRDA